MSDLQKWQTNCVPNWCPGCGNYNLWQAFKEALSRSGKEAGETVLVAGIGCHGHIHNFTKTSSFEGLHGRPIPVAVGIKLANHDLQVVVSTGDGDCLGEGGNHLIHAVRRNDDLTVILHNNGSYSLTTGQTSPASPQGYRSKSTPRGKVEPALNPLALVLAAGGGFVARGFAGEPGQLAEILTAALNYRGLAVVEVLQPCVVFNQVFSFDFFREKTAVLPKRVETREEAFGKVQWGEKIWTGVIYEEKMASYESQLPQLEKMPLVKQPLKNYQWEKLIEEFG